jgi:Divergent InlB B-repeat domain
MNKGSDLLVIAMTIALSFSISQLDAQIAASSDPTKLILTVEEGTASGNYAAGEQVTVSANAPKTGAQFAGWKGDVAILANPSLPTTTATIPFIAVTITATYTAPATNLSPGSGPVTHIPPAANSHPGLGRGWEG